MDELSCSALKALGATAGAEQRPDFTLRVIACGADNDGPTQRSKIAAYASEGSLDKRLDQPSFGITTVLAFRSAIDEQKRFVN